MRSLRKTSRQRRSRLTDVISNSSSKEASHKDAVRVVAILARMRRRRTKSLLSSIQPLRNTVLVIGEDLRKQRF